MRTVDVSRLARPIRRFMAATGGGVAIWTAVAVPPLAMLSVGAVELASLHADKGQLQDAADAAALAAAREYGIAGPGGVEERARAMALQQTADVARHATVQATATLNVRESAIRVEITSHRMSFFGNLLPPGGFRTRVVSTANSLGDTPLCVVGMSSSGTNIKMNDTSRIQAAACLVQSNGDVDVAGGANIIAGEVQVNGASKGRGTSPVALEGAPELADPFASRPITFPTSCNLLETLGKIIAGPPTTLQPGMHCGNIEIESGATLNLAPGVHYFRDSDIKMKGTGRLTGNGVVLIFDNKSSIEAKENAVIDLQGVRTGVWAGFVIVGPRAPGEDFKFESGRVDRLEGVIYLPNTKLIVDSFGTTGTGSTQVGETSNWTVTLAREIEVKGSTALTINANYAASTVPVPTGVGPRPQGTRLSR